MACKYTYKGITYNSKEEFISRVVNSQILRKADVILPIGTSGSGKSTFIKSLSQENLVVIEPDAMRVEFTGDINDKSKDKEVYEEAAKRAVTAIKQGKQIVFDTTNLTKDKRTPFIEAIKKALPNANIQYKLMELNPELAKQRIKAQIARGENRANVPDSTIDRHVESYKQMLEDIKNEPITTFINRAPTKTRRILEVQSDLFQKGRNSFGLVNTFVGVEEAFKVFKDSIVFFKKDSKYYRSESSSMSFDNIDEELTEISLEEYNKEKAEAPELIYLDTSDSNENQFLQLLNKNNNWVTFFVKSIIQDSAKKGYEKVLFPKGDTAAKVEGHETLEEFIRERQKRIDGGIETLKNAEIKFPNDIGIPEEMLKKLNNIRNGVKQFQKEIEDAKAGKLKVSSIANFYENTIKNILKKLGSIQEIVDEYNNGWYEVNLSDPNFVKETENILFNLKLQGQYSQIPEVALQTLTKNGFVNKFNPNETVFEDRWYFNQSQGLENSQRRFQQYMSMNNLNRDMFKEGISSNGIPYIVPNQNFNLVDSIEENNERIHKDKYEAIISFFKDKFNIPEDKINYISKKEFSEKFPEIYKENAQSVYYKGKFYFFTNNQTADITVEELLHPFIYTVKELNKELFANLLKEAQRNYPLLHQKIQTLYKSQPQSIRDQELVTQALARVFNNVYENEEPKSLIDVLKDFVYWLQETFNDILSYFGTGKTINLNIDELSPQLNLEEIAQIINATDTKFDLIFPEGSFYNLSTNAEDFNAVITKLLTDKRVEANVEKILVRIPDAIKSIRKRLNSTTTKDEKQQLQNVLKQIEEFTGEDKQSLLKAQLKGIITTVQLFNNLEEELNTVDRSNMDSNLKLAYYMSMHKTAESLEEFKDLIQELNDELKTNLRQINNPNIERFQLLLNKSLNAKDNIYYKLNKLILSPLLEELVKSSENSYSEPLNNINKKILDLEKQLTNTTSLQEKDKIQNKLVQLYKEKAGILQYAPTRENLEKVFNSQFKDANQLSYLLEAKIANGHPLVNTLQSIINNIYDDAGANMLNSKNEMQTALNEYTKATGKSLRDMEKLYEGIGDNTVALPTELKFDDKGEPQFTYVNQNTLTHSIDNQYITEYMKLEMLKKHYFDLSFEDLKKDIKDSPNTLKYKEAFEAFEAFKKENTQRQYSDEYYEFRAMLDEKVGDKTIRQITNDAYDEIDRLKDALDRSDSSTRDNIDESIKVAKAALKKLRSEYNDDGSKKDGDSLRVANVLNDYNKLRYVYGSDVLTDEGQANYKLDLEALNFKKDQYHPDDYNKLISKLQQKIISPEYFEAILSITDNINLLSNDLADLASNSEISKYIVSNTIKEKRKNVYKEIQDVTRPYRDDNQIIDGITLTNQNPDLVKRIKDLQQYIEDLKLDTFKFTSLSPNETNEYNTLRANLNKTVDEQLRWNELDEKRTALTKFKKQNISIIENLSSLFKELGNLSTTSNTDYYKEFINDKLDSYKNNKDVVDFAIKFIDENDSFTLNGIKYIKEAGKWYKEEKVGKKIHKAFIGDLGISTDTGYQEVLDIIIAYKADLELKDSTWWKDNHFIQYIFNNKTFNYEPSLRPIYIWEHQTPNNPNFIETIPAKRYSTYTVKEEYINQDYSMLYKNIPTAKPGKFVSKKYQDVQKDPIKAKFLNFLQNKYTQSQNFLPDNSKMGPVLPAIIKTSGENSVNTTNKLLSFDGTFKEIFHSNAGVTDTDTSYLVGGSQSNNKTIPVRFTGKMDTSSQSKNLAGSILLFEYHSSLYNALNDKLPIFEASQLLAAKVETLENKNSLDRLSFIGKVRKVFSPKKEETAQETQKKEIEKTILSKTIDSQIDTFIYGQRIKPEIVNMGPIGNVDLAKVSSNVLGFAAKAIFIGNIISAVNNSISTRLQAIVNSGIKSNLYSLSNLKNAQALSVKYGPNLLLDWTKLGNKSLIGQVLDHFSFLAENPGREITSKSEYTLIKNKMDFLTSPKQISEFEVLFIQFMTIADATIVKVNGKDVKLSHIKEIFEIKDGKFQTKKGVELSKNQEEIFRGKYQSMARKLAGAYRGTEQSSIEANWAGKSAMFLRRYFVGMATNRFAGERWNTQEQEVQIGYQRETFKNLVKLFTEYKGKIWEQWPQLTDKEKASVYKTTLEYGTLILLIGLLSLAGGDDDKKKLKENSWEYNMSLVALLRAKTEMEQFTLKGADDLVRMGKNPFMVFTTIGNVTKTIGLVYPTIMGSDVAYYQQNTGLHKKGDSKLLATLFKLFGYTGATFNPEEYIVNFRNAQNR